MGTSITEVLDLAPHDRVYIIAPVAGGELAVKLLSMAASGRALIIITPNPRNRLYTLAREWVGGGNNEHTAVLLVIAGGLLSTLPLLADPGNLGLVLGLTIMAVTGSLAWLTTTEEPPVNTKATDWLTNLRVMEGLNTYIVITGKTAWHGRDCNNLAPAPPEWARKTFERLWPMATPNQGQPTNPQH